MGDDASDVVTHLASVVVSTILLCDAINAEPAILIERNAHDVGVPLALHN